MTKRQKRMRYAREYNMDPERFKKLFARRVRCLSCNRLHSRESSHHVGWQPYLVQRRKIYQCDPCYHGSDRK